ncbi:hypothetical protein OV450_4726, partial [Actinobacteria bacterium OV450]
AEPATDPEPIRPGGSGGPVRPGAPGGPEAGARPGVPDLPGPADPAPPDAGPLYFAATAWFDSLTADLGVIESGRVAAASHGPT